MVKQATAQELKKTTFKKLFILIQEIETQQDLDAFMYGYVDRAFQFERITYSDHEAFFNLYDILSDGIKYRESRA